MPLEQFEHVSVQSQLILHSVACAPRAVLKFQCPILILYSMLSAFRAFPDMSVEQFPTCPCPVLILHFVLFAFRAVLTCPCPVLILHSLLFAFRAVPACPCPVSILHSVLFAFRAVPNMSVSSLNSSLCIIYPYSRSERVIVQSSFFTLCCLPLEQFPTCPCPVLILYSASSVPIAVPNVSVSSLNTFFTLYHLPHD